MITFNANTLVSVKTKGPVEVTPFFTYLPPKPKTFCSKGREEGVWMDVAAAYTKQELLSGEWDYPVNIEGERVFLKPYVKLDFANGKSTTKYFDTKEEAQAFYKENIEKYIPEDKRIVF